MYTEHVRTYPQTPVSRDSNIMMSGNQAGRVCKCKESLSKQADKIQNMTQKAK